MRRRSQHSSTFFGTFMSYNFHGHDDFINVLKTLHRDAEEKHEALLRQIRDLGGEPTS
jgi:hypothetical protein